ncbi:hypothetical protein HanRHA438_Chr13g0616131 [Helianthus annuus]|uniref:Uncharacterized protein n=1 Tax=Helianthus annuus TaxID=4232 RepID=A0A9K3EK89_HELAN|nr:hypothetical protein HanXRQr2_Chr13g0605661 [Helianthus annuus]KAJ0478120.1 hypothetical protein HanHA300_Chr13g0496641 [Helianthus annuus]KAJ0482790.1 hypothetical protein HanIR_Chr13g0657801 [Helianthus annuus]KAJ0499002.1 hypothetical protein HanHA89_Chr13g0529291 [Helianthus annuus]KAJ0665016.1 hypothetical protein HanLR1_Chr13g0499321 [Helianthus annuus]
MEKKRHWLPFPLSSPSLLNNKPYFISQHLHRPPHPCPHHLRLPPPSSSLSSPPPPPAAELHPGLFSKWICFLVCWKWMLMLMRFLLLLKIGGGCCGGDGVVVVVTVEVQRWWVLWR